MFQSPPHLPPGHSSPQASYAMQGYSLPAHQPLPHGFPSIGQLSQVNVSSSYTSSAHEGPGGLSAVVCTRPVLQSRLVCPLQAHVAGGMSGPHHSAGHGLPPVMLHYVPPQQGSGSNPQQGAAQHFYIGPPQGKTHREPAAGWILVLLKSSSTSQPPTLTGQVQHRKAPIRGTSSVSTFTSKASN